MTRRMTIMLLILGLLFGAIFGFQFFKNMMMKKYMSAPPPPVTVSAMKASKQMWESTISAVGSLRAVRGVDVTTEITGLVKEVHITSGKQALRGELLVKLNDDAERAQLESLIAEELYARQKYERDKAQLAIKAVSKQTVDESLSNLRSMSAKILEQKAIIAKKNIRAPFAGRLGITTINPGQYLNPGDKIVTLQTLHPILVDFNLPQQNLKDLAIGQTVTLSSDAFPNENFAGKITAINPKVDVETRNVQVEAMVDNTKFHLLPGMFAPLKVIVGAPKSYLTLPLTAISFNPYGDIAYLVEGKPEKVKQVFIKVGQTRGDQAAILTGIKEGDMVVTTGLLKLKNGTPVAINNKIVPTFDAQPKVKDE